VVNGSLLPAFLDGMLANATPGTTFIDGFEQGYVHNNDPNYFSTWHKITFDDDKYNMRFQKYPDRFKRQWQFGAGLWIDRDRDENGKHGVFGWCGDNKQNIFYSPGRLAFTVQQAMKASDGYVWVYSMKPNCWLPPGTPGAMPQALADAFRDGARHANNSRLPPLPANTDPIAESAVCR
jgi:hypothetical protein